MTPNEQTVLRFLQAKGTPQSDTQVRNQLVIDSGALQTIMRSLKTKLLVSQDSRYYRLTSLGETTIGQQASITPFTGQPIW